MFEKKDIVKIIFLGIVALILIIITVIITNIEQPQENNKSNNINKNEIISNTIGNNQEQEETKTVKYVEYKVNYNLTNEERTLMQEQAEKREMEGGFDDKNLTR